MNNALSLMIEKYHPANNQEKENAFKEIIQEIVLSGLSRGGFFEKAAFYGGTCLRIFYGLDRFSEDLDFALLENDADFSIDHYFPFISKELKSYGLDMDISFKEKDKDNEIQTAFIKGNALFLMMQFFPQDEETKQIVGNQKIKIKFEIDVDNPLGGHTEIKYRLLPSPYSVKVFDEATLFAGKIHAIICRDYKNRIKGRDFYDYLFYCAKNTKINLKYLENKLKITGKLNNDESLSLDSLKALLKDKFEKVDYISAINDVSNFISNKDALRLWNKELFNSTLDTLKAE